AQFHPELADFGFQTLLANRLGPVVEGWRDMSHLAEQLGPTLGAHVRNWTDLRPLAELLDRTMTLGYYAEQQEMRNTWAADGSPAKAAQYRHLVERHTREAERLRTILTHELQRRAAQVHLEVNQLLAERNMTPTDIVAGRHAYDPRSELKRPGGYQDGSRQIVF